MLCHSQRNARPRLQVGSVAYIRQIFTVPPEVDTLVVQHQEQGMTIVLAGLCHVAPSSAFLSPAAVWRARCTGLDQKSVSCTGGLFCCSYGPPWRRNATPLPLHPTDRM